MFLSSSRDKFTILKQNSVTDVSVGPPHSFKVLPPPVHFFFYSPQQRACLMKRNWIDVCSAILTIVFALCYKSFVIHFEFICRLELSKVE